MNHSYVKYLWAWFLQRIIKTSYVKYLLAHFLMRTVLKTELIMTLNIRIKMKMRMKITIKKKEPTTLHLEGLLTASLVDGVVGCCVSLLEEQAESHGIN